MLIGAHRTFSEVRLWPLAFAVLLVTAAAITNKEEMIDKKYFRNERIKDPIAPEDLVSVTRMTNPEDCILRISLETHPTRTLVPFIQSQLMRAIT
ncbi:hypothetical protein RB195_013739 [Necator americanus]|uniref:Uncharacterized protein n=1 Tax=Necator americanus TaxID=51031 RepID=A0ABR1DXJ7_NECAM